MINLFVFCVQSWLLEKSRSFRIESGITYSRLKLGATDNFILLLLMEVVAPISCLMRYVRS